ncbi:hypothetical protein KAU92_00675 [Candidatus Bathyarchaeota archaeon]|nr:hypothetical protein [Candidatus Bathyarchaeota archaeon]
MSENQTIEMETVTIKLPKAIMDLLRNSEEITGRSPIEQLQYSIVADIEGCVNSEILTPTPQQIIKKYKLGHVFKAILNC